MLINYKWMHNYFLSISIKVIQWLMKYFANTHIGRFWQIHYCLPLRLWVIRKNWVADRCKSRFYPIFINNFNHDRCRKEMNGFACRRLEQKNRHVYRQWAPSLILSVFCGLRQAWQLTRSDMWDSSLTWVHRLLSCQREIWTCRRV